MDFLGIGGWEIIIILIIAFFLLGPSKIVSFARTMGKLVNTVKKTTSEFTSQLDREFNEQKKEINTEVTKRDKT